MEAKSKEVVTYAPLISEGFSEKLSIKDLGTPNRLTN
jgi:hypothetical protein